MLYTYKYSQIWGSPEPTVDLSVCLFTVIMSSLYSALQSVKLHHTASQFSHLSHQLSQEVCNTFRKWNLPLPFLFVLFKVKKQNKQTTHPSSVRFHFVSEVVDLKQVSYQTGLYVTHDQYIWECVHSAHQKKENTFVCIREFTHRYVNNLIIFSTIR